MSTVARLILRLIGQPDRPHVVRFVDLSTDRVLRVRPPS